MSFLDEPVFGRRGFVKLTRPMICFFCSRLNSTPVSLDRLASACPLELVESVRAVLFPSPLVTGWPWSRQFFLGFVPCLGVEQGPLNLLFLSGGKVRFWTIARLSASISFNLAVRLRGKPLTPAFSPKRGRGSQKGNESRAVRRPSCIAAVQVLPTIQNAKRFGCGCR